MPAKANFNRIKQSHVYLYKAGAAECIALGPLKYLNCESPTEYGKLLSESRNESLKTSRGSILRSSGYNTRGVWSVLLLEAKTFSLSLQNAAPQVKGKCE